MNTAQQIVNALLEDDAKPEKKLPPWLAKKLGHGDDKEKSDGEESDSDSEPKSKSGGGGGKGSFSSGETVKKTW